MAKNKIPLCPFCGALGHTLSCNFGSKVSAEDRMEIEKRRAESKKKFDNTRIYKSVVTKKD